MIRYVLLIIFVTAGKGAFSQSAWTSFWKLSGPEKWWVIGHPFVANKARKITLEARMKAAEMKLDTVLDGDDDGGQVDAFRHSYWMARLAQSFCWKKAVKLGRAHEKANYRSFKRRQLEDKSVPDSIASVMDLYNNEIGAGIGCNNPDCGSDSLKILIRTAIKNGRMLKVSKNKLGEQLDCENKVIDLSLYKNKWYVPKCLINSDL
jgi:hypothetical protein